MERIQIDGKSAVFGALAGGAACGVLGYLLGSRRMRKSAEQRIESEVQSVKDHYQHRADLAAAGADHDDDRIPAVGPEDPVDETESVDPRLEGIEGRDDYEDGLEQVDVENLTYEPPPDSPPAPLVNRDAAKPYAISVEEFGEQGDGWQQLTITYYALDKVLVDDKDQPIRDIQGTVGPLDALGFGGISGDPHIRYVRCHKLEIDFEIVLDARSYADVILNYGNPNRGIKQE
jgi:hypothetical protein